MDKAQLSQLRLDRIGFVFQAYNLIPVLTAFENAEFVLMMRGVPAAERRQRVLGRLKAVGLERWRTDDPRNSPVGNNGGLPSHGPSSVSRRWSSRTSDANLDSKKNELISLMRRLNSEQGITFMFATRPEGDGRHPRHPDGRQ